jgi:hypothetical protein
MLWIAVPHRFAGSVIRGDMLESLRPLQSLLRVTSKAHASEQ